MRKSFTLVVLLYSCVFIAEFDANFCMSETSFAGEKIITSFREGPDSPYSIPCDLDMDGDKDILSSSEEDGHIYWFENKRNQHFKTHFIVSRLEKPRAIDVGDIDNDGDMDFVVGNREFDTETAIVWFENDGYQNFEEIVVSTEAGAIMNLSVLDFDQDDDLDIIIHGQNTAIFENNDGFDKGIVLDYRFNPLLSQRRSTTKKGCVSGQSTNNKVKY